MFEQVLKIIFPNKCIFCNEIIDISMDLEICKECYGKIEFVNSRELVYSDGYYTNVVGVGYYGGILKESIKKFKYMNSPHYFRTFAKLMVEKILANGIDADIIISVPLYKSRERERGYNQAHLIAKEIGKIMGKKYNKNTLERIKDTGVLALCDKRDRESIIKGAFKVRNVELVKDKKIILIDDVFTTGSTINECSKVLKESGAGEIIVVVLAVGRSNKNNEKGRYIRRRKWV